MSNVEGKIVVGYDGSAEAKLAVRWASRVAARRQRTLVVVTSTGVEKGSRTAYTPALVHLALGKAQAVADEGVVVAREEALLEVESLAVDRGAVASLVDLSLHAELVVVGSRGRGRLRGALLGSVAFGVTTHADGPVAVFRGSRISLPGPNASVVVGVDGSDANGQALRSAGQLASETDAQLRIVVAYNDSGGGAEIWSSAANLGSGREGDLRSLSWQLERSARRIASEASSRIRASYPEVNVETFVESGRPEDAILRATRESGLVVMGARGGSELQNILMGSVSRAVIHQADVPVYIAR